MGMGSFRGERIGEANAMWKSYRMRVALSSTLYYKVQPSRHYHWAPSQKRQDFVTIAPLWPNHRPPQSLSALRPKTTLRSQAKFATTRSPRSVTHTTSLPICPRLKLGSASLPVSSQLRAFTALWQKSEAGSSAAI